MDGEPREGCNAQATAGHREQPASFETAPYQPLIKSVLHERVETARPRPYAEWVVQSYKRLVCRVHVAPEHCSMLEVCMALEEIGRVGEGKIIGV